MPPIRMHLIRTLETLEHNAEEGCADPDCPYTRQPEACMGNRLELIQRYVNYVE